MLRIDMKTSWIKALVLIRIRDSHRIRQQFKFPSTLVELI